MQIHPTCTATIPALYPYFTRIDFLYPVLYILILFHTTLLPNASRPLFTSSCTGCVYISLDTNPPL